MMSENGQNLMAWKIWSKASYSPLLFGIQVLLASSGLVLTSSSIQAQEASNQQPQPSESPVYTSAKYLLTPQAAVDGNLPSSTAATPEMPASTPGFSQSQSASAAPPSLSPDQRSMQAPVPAPPPIMAQASAPVPYVDGAATSHSEAVVEPTESNASASGEAAPSYDSVFIDPTDYSLGATTNPDMPSLVFSERSSGCEVTVAGTQMSQNCGAASSNEPEVAANSRQNSGVQIGPVNVSSRGVSVGNTTVVSREFLNEKLRPLNILRRGAEEYIFPLSIPAPISSLFGWRVHPIYGDHRFHSGTDLSAPMGTPVLATQAGRVAIADNLGGYGLTVILRHGDGDIESRYAHLSRIAVRPGEWIEQGEVIGLVGSTGNSTGPHLHFEVRQLTEQGWVAADAQEILEEGLSNLIATLNNPLQAMAQSAAIEGEQELPTDYPFRPAQPNAS